ncbi:hypothetical protein BGW80DRAFT_37551 [Lactifluus volemus]|nr:hypothetical protein BGW80DRAFT_37551 [Lactifluus volemus]
MSSFFVDKAQGCARTEDLNTADKACQKKNYYFYMSRPPKSSEAVRKRTIWESYAALPAKTRLNISLAVCAVAVAGIFISDRLEKICPHPPKQLQIVLHDLRNEGERAS